MRRAKIAPDALPVLLYAIGVGAGRIDRAIEQTKALIAAATAAGEADVLHDGIHDVGAKPKTCAGCRLVRALARLDRVSREGR